MSVGFGSLGSIFVNIGAKLDGLTTGLKDAGTKLDKFASKVGAIGQKMTIGITAPLAAIGGVASTAFSKIDEGMRTVNTIAKESEGQLKKTTDELLKIGVALGKRPTELTAALYDINSSSFVGAEGLKVLEASAKAGVAGLASTQSAAKAITGVLNAFGLESSEAMNVSDALFKTVEKGVVTFDQLSQHMGSSISTARAIGVSYDDLFSTIATMTRGGIESAEAFTAVNMAMVKMIEGGEELDAIANKMGHASIYAAVKAEGLGKVIAQMALETNGDAKAIQELGFDVRAFKAMANLASNGGKEFNKDLEAMANKAGATQAAFEEQSKAFSFSIKVLKATLESAGYYIGEILAPNILNMANALRNAGNWFLNLDKKTKKLIVTIAGIAAAVGPVLLLGKAFLAVKSAIFAVNGALLLLNTNPVVLGITAISAAVAFLGAAIVNHFGKGETFMQRLVDVGQQVKGKVIEVAGSVANVLGPSFEVLRNFVQNAWATLGDLFNEFKRSEFAAAAMDAISKAVNWVKDRVGDLNKILGKAFWKLVELGGGGETMAEKISSAVKSIVHIFSQAFLVSIPQFFAKLFINAKATIQQMGASFKILGEDIANIFKNAFGNVKAYFEALWEKIKDPTKEFKVDLVSITKGTSFDPNAPVSAGQKQLVDSMAKQAEELKAVQSAFDAYGLAVYDDIENKFKSVKKDTEAAKKATDDIVKNTEKAVEKTSAPMSAAETAPNVDAIRAELGLGAPGAGMTSAAVAPADTLSSKGHNLPWFNKMMGWSQPVAPATTSAAQTLDTLAQTAGGSGAGTEPTATIRDGTGRAVQALKDIGSIILEMAGEFELVKAQISTARA